MSAPSEGESADGGGSDPDDEPTRTVTYRPDDDRPGDDPDHPDAAERNFGWRGDVLLAVLLFALVVAPLVVYLRPPALSWRVRLLIFPLLPALLLAVVAVWATTRP